MTPQRHALLGLFFFGVIGILGYFTLFKTDFQLFGERHALTVHFNRAAGLRAGDPVLVAGVRWGQVARLDFDPDSGDPRERITVELTLHAPVKLFSDHRIVVEDATVLGGKNLIIEPGSPAAGAFGEDRLYGSVSRDVLSALAEVVDENRASLRDAIEGIAALVKAANDGEGPLGAILNDPELRGDLEAAVAAFRGTFENAQELTTALREGDGTLAKLLRDAELYDEIKGIAARMDTFLAEAEGLVRDAREGDGALAMLLHDAQLAADVKTAVADIATTTGRLARGEGTIGELLVDPTVAQNLKALSQSLVDSDGTLGLLIHDRAMYDDLLAIASDLRTFADQLANGDGTLARLAREDDVYLELELALRTLTGSLEEAREAAPISTFLNALFLGF
jgi:phospholipid/cholesterol/gamma-HCH transport system substrate-binding protein